MFCVIYKFKVKEKKEELFLKSWSDFTEAIHRVSGSLGSRIHATEDPSVYIAYAQWPSRDIFDNAALIDSYSKEEQLARDSMVDSTDEIKILHKLDVIADLLR